MDGLIWDISTDARVEGDIPVGVGCGQRHLPQGGGCVQRHPGLGGARRHYQASSQIKGSA